jgi:hypothetical protein
VNFLGLGKIAAIPAACMGVKSLASFTNVLLLQSLPSPISIFQVHFHDALFTPDKFYENRKIGL